MIITLEIIKYDPIAYIFKHSVHYIIGNLLYFSEPLEMKCIIINISIN